MARAGSRGVAIKGDVAVENDAVGMFDVATRALGPLTAVIANAGIVAPMSRLVDMGAEWMRHIFEVDVLGAFLTAREAARRYQDPQAEPEARLRLCRRPRPLGLAQSLRRLCHIEGRHRHTDLGSREGVGTRRGQSERHPSRPHRDGNPRKRDDPDRARTLGATAPLGRPGTVEEIAAAATWLISDAASLRNRRAAGRFGRALSGDLNESGPKPRSRQFDALGHAP